MSNSRRWREWITWWRALDDTDYPDQYALIEAINNKIHKICLNDIEEQIIKKERG